ncbi:cysteine hydrolase family protein [Paenibacillus beijingensis]|uniref:Isochorismatase n=1 Tax=Paenibacillus beijingensis TaxID=1126833 RepID=A0A0D5NFI4_9BACL|nr:cysteine hydrolase family protein [Paenibacillus beijingensis]AJY73663.1 isochorismatase [Paenibacillus beijingensis]
MNADTALLVIDVQVGMFPETDPVYAGEVLLERIRGLIAKARACAVPIIYVQHNEDVGEPLESNSPAWNIHPMIAPHVEDTIIQKYTPDSFHETNLQHELAGKGIKKLVLTGIQTDLCVNATCRRACTLGYEVIVAKDAHSTWSQGNLSAVEIINQYNDLFGTFAKTEESANIEFCTRS